MKYRCLIRRVCHTSVVLGLFLLASTDSRPACAQTSVAHDVMDWPNWRGPQQNRTSTEHDLIDRWDPKGGPGSNLIWKNDELGGRSTPIVMRGRLYTIVRDQPGTDREGEKVVCVDAATGEKLWEYRFNVYLSEVPDTRVGWSSCTGDPETGRIYVQSVSGYFCCLEGESGEVVWDRSMHEELGVLSTYGGRTNIPLVFEDQVIASAVVIGWGDAPKWGFLAKPAHRFLGFDKATGQLRWIGGTRISPYDTTYSTPTITVLDGQAAIVFGSGDGAIWALQPRTGEKIWHYPFSRRGVNASPLVVDNTVFASHSEENVVGTSMGSLVALDGSKLGDMTGKEIWQRFQVMAGKASPVMLDGKLWIVDDRAKLHVFDPETGEQFGRRKPLGTVMRSTPLVADGKVYLCTNSGRWYILKPTDDGPEIIHKLRLKGEASDGSPIVSHGRIYLPTSAAIYCIGDPDVEPSADPLPPPARETPVANDPLPAIVQVEPFDVLLSPGDVQAYQVRLYNSRGQLLREVPHSEVRFRVDGPGSIGADGRYSAAVGSGHDTALVVCRVGELEGTARVRVVPPLPWSFDFNEGDKVPLTWVGGRVRYVVREVDGEKIAVKRGVLPTPRDPNNKLGTRSYMYMGQTKLTNYTIQADFALTMSTTSGNLLNPGGRTPDIGLINSRYTMTVRSSNNQLRLYSWSPHDRRTFAEVDFAPEPYAWYTMKLQVVPHGETASVRGKLWVRGAAEPADWTIEMVDKSPNLSGSPGLYGNAQEAEIYVDNITVVSNE